MPFHSLKPLLLSFGLAWTSGPAQAGSTMSTQSVSGGLSSHLVTPKSGLLMQASNRFEGPISPAGESNLFYNLFGTDSPSQWCFALSAGFGPDMEWTLARESAFKTYAGIIKWAGWSQTQDQTPLSLTLTLNTHIRTDRDLDDDKRVSFGGGVMLARKWWGERLEVSTSLLGQTHTNATQRQLSPDHSAAAAVGCLMDLQPLTLFLESVIPISLSEMGYRESFSRQDATGIPPLGAGFQFQHSWNRFTVSVTNDTRMLAANYVAGIREPLSGRLQEWRLGFSYSRLFYPHQE